METEKPSEWVERRAKTTRMLYEDGFGHIATINALVEYLDKLHEEGKI